jgi:hypothetical protein
VRHPTNWEELHSRQTEREQSRRASEEIFSLMHKWYENIQLPDNAILLRRKFSG